LIKVKHQLSAKEFSCAFMPGSRIRVRIRFSRQKVPLSVMSRHRGAPLRMLIVEDNPHVADVLIDECEMALGAEVVTVGTGDMALQVLARSPPTLALVELALPDMSGFEVARCAAHNDVPAIVMSGHPEKMLLCEEHGFPHLSKPFSIFQLTSLATQVVREAEQNIAQLQRSYARLKATMEASKRIVEVARKTTRASAEARARRQMNQFGHC
jgi:DNA-binding response OmpR family regulator